MLRAWEERSDIPDIQCVADSDTAGSGYGIVELYLFKKGLQNNKKLGVQVLTYF